jgi:hypothetical protein
MGELILFSVIGLWSTLVHWFARLVFDKKEAKFSDRRLCVVVTSGGTEK